MANSWVGIYGRGWKFPPEFTQAGPVMVLDEEDIAQSLEILFRTEPGERIMRPDYGCGLQAVVFENISSDLFAALRIRIADSVLSDEPRVDLDDLRVEQVSGLPNHLYIQVSYRLQGIDQLETVGIELDLNSGFSTLRRLGARHDRLDTFRR